MRKRLWVLAFVAVFAVGLAWAGSGQHGQKMDVASHVAKLKTELNLTDQQAEKVKTLFEDIHQRKMALKSKTTDPQSPAAQEEYKKLMSEQDASLKEILTPEQFTKYEQLKTQHANKARTEHKPQ